MDCSSKIIPPQIIFQILVRVPASSLQQFRLVSKSWHKINASPKFRDMHLHQSKKDPKNFALLGYVPGADPNMGAKFGRLDLVDPPLHIEMCNFKRSNDRSFWSIVGSCNGIVCLASYTLGANFRVALFNPVTRECKDLPPAKPRPDSDECVTYGFGYDAISKDYVVVRFISMKDGYIISSEVEYCSSLLGTPSWHKIESIPYVNPDPGAPYSEPGVFVGGALHWVVATREDPFDEDVMVLIAFDVTDKRFDQVPLPDHHIEDGLLKVGVTELNGYLCFLCYYKRCLKTWSMRNYMVKDSWSLMFTLDVTSLYQILTTPYSPADLHETISIPYSCFPICTDDEDVIVLGCYYESLILYNLQTKSARYATVAENQLAKIDCPTVFVESLVVLNTGGSLPSPKKTEKKTKKKRTKSWR